jgi:hypothetical protein
MRALRLASVAALALAASALPATASAETLTAFGARVEPKPAGFGRATVGGLRLSGRPFGLYGLKARIALEAATDIDEGTTPNGRAFGFTSYGAYINARTRGPFYLVGEYGIARNRLSIDGGGSTTDNQTRVAVGLGIATGNMRIEATVGRFDESDRLSETRWITLGFRF